MAVPAQSARVEAFLAEARVTGRVLALARLVEPGPEKAPFADVSESPATESPATGSGLPVVAWNPLSFASARAAVIEAETALGGSLDEIVIFADPPAGRTPLVDSTPRDIEKAALVWAAGYAELIREAARRFTEKGGGSITLVITQADRGPLGAMAAGALTGLAEGLMAIGPGAYRFCAIKDESTQTAAQADLLARHIVKLLDEPPRDAGKFQKFGSRAGLFGR